MIKQLFKLSLLIALIAATPFTSVAKFPGLLKRFQLGYSFVSNTADYTGAYRIINPAMNVDTTFKPFEMKTSVAWGFTAGTYIPLKRLGKVSSLNLGVDYLYNMMTWKSDVPSIGSFGISSFDGVTVQMALPVGLDFKFGSDAVQQRTPAMCATLGAGVYPSYALTSLTGAPITLDPAFSIAPYVKAEVGFFAGVCMKVRAIYAIGDLTYMNYENTSNSMGELKTSSKLVGKSNLAISLLIMPFSFKWDNEEWWNTY